MAGLLPIYAAGALATLVAALSGCVIAARRMLRLRAYVSGAALVFSGYLLVLQFLKLYALRDYADFAISAEIMRNITLGRGAWSSINAA